VNANTDAPEPDDPLPIKDGGLYFDGAKRYLAVSGLVLNYSFSIQVWFKVQGIAFGTIYAIDRRSTATPADSNDVFIFRVDPDTV
jgi:hypothetical protein